MSNIKKKEEAALVKINFEQDAGKGQESAGADECAIPFLTMLQGLSPQIETVDGAKPGMLLNTITDELYKEAKVVPCAFRRRYIRWAPRESGGGYRGAYSPTEVETGAIGAQQESGLYTIEGDILQDTREHFVLVQSAEGSWQPALLALKSTQIKKSKRWMSRIKGLELKGTGGKPYNPPSFSCTYVVKAVKEESSKGAWWGYDIKKGDLVEDETVYLKAKKFHDDVVSGDVSVQEPSAAERGGNEGNF